MEEKGKEEKPRVSNGSEPFLVEDHAKFSKDPRTAEWSEEEMNLLVWYEKNVRSNIYSIFGYLDKFILKSHNNKYKYYTDSANFFLNEIRLFLVKYRKYTTLYNLSFYNKERKFKELLKSWNSAEKEIQFDPFEHMLTLGLVELETENDFREFKEMLQFFSAPQGYYADSLPLVIDAFPIRFPKFIDDKVIYSAPKYNTKTFELDFLICYLFFFIASNLHPKFIIDPMITMRMGSIVLKLSNVISDSAIISAIKGPELDRLRKGHEGARKNRVEKKAKVIEAFQKIGDITGLKKSDIARRVSKKMEITCSLKSILNYLDEDNLI
ncbi:MAG: hypothetical protein KKA60_09010 [Proteobacteria bacterium]|nr:hypothetical protein [Pseudomonadota bacterium]